MTTNRSQSNTYVIKLSLSLPFFRPPKAILVPGMYFLGFSRYSNWTRVLATRRFGHKKKKKKKEEEEEDSYQSVLIPCHIGFLVGVGVGETLDGTGVTAKETVQIRANLVRTALFDGVALSATGLEKKVLVEDKFL